MTPHTVLFVPPAPHSRLPAPQLRGSIPLIWTQIPNIKYKPPTKLLPGEPSAAAFDAHVEALLAKYKVGGWSECGGSQVLGPCCCCRGAPGRACDWAGS